MSEFSASIPRLKIAALVVAGGRGHRVGGDMPKQYRKIAGRSVLCRAIEAVQAHDAITDTLVVIHRDDQARFKAVTGDSGALAVTGGATRQESVHCGLQALAARGAPDIVLIHDAARPFLDPAVMTRLLVALDTHDGAVPALRVVDSLRKGDGEQRLVGADVSRDGLWRLQTPQAFHFAKILAAHAAARPGASDDAAVARDAGYRIAIIDGDERLAKLTTEDDFARANAQFAATRTVRMGTGFDVHRFAEGDHLWLCGVRISHDQGLAGHSDADVGLHALTDALLGASGDGDIGDHFPPSDPKWAGADSAQFLTHAAQLIAARDGTIDHVDVTLICEKPRIGVHRAAMRARISTLLAISEDRVSVKATTTEKLGFTGRGEGIAAQAAATVRL